MRLNRFRDVFAGIAHWKRTMLGTINGSLIAYLLGITEINPLATGNAISNALFAGPTYEKRILWKIGLSESTEAELISRLIRAGIRVRFVVNPEEQIDPDTQFRIFIVHARECELLRRLQTLTGFNPSNIQIDEVDWIHRALNSVFEEDLYGAIAEKTGSPATAYRIAKKLQHEKELSNEEFAECEKAGTSIVAQRILYGDASVVSKSEALAKTMQLSRLAYYADHWPDIYESVCFMKENGGNQ